MSNLTRKGLRLVALCLAVTVSLGGNCDPKGPDYFDLIDGGLDPSTGDIFGRVTVDGAPRSGVTVTLRQSTTVIDTEVTDGNGDYEFLELDPGTYSVSIAEITGADCPGEQTAVVVADEETARNFACTTSQPQTGTVTGTVTVNGSGESGVEVTLRDGTTVIGTTQTGTGGTYSFTNVATGAKNVSITPPEGATCTTAQQDVTVPAGGTATANFACTRPSGSFTPTFISLVTDHRGNTSVICWVLGTTPIQPGATFQVTTTGPGVLNPSVNGTLNSNGQAGVEVGINLFGTYNIMQTVTSGANQESASTTHTVDPTEGTCPVAQSSVRFKQGVTALLPDDVRPLGLRPVAFRYREPWGDPAEPQIGLIAEEVAEVYPEAVLMDAEGRPHAIDYHGLTQEVAEAVVSGTARAIRAALAGMGESW
jgi:hypothetical protein